LEKRALFHLGLPIADENAQFWGQATCSAPAGYAPHRS
jgi:hypothetical protein